MWRSLPTRHLHCYDPFLLLPRVSALRWTACLSIHALPNSGSMPLKREGYSRHSQGRSVQREPGLGISASPPRLLMHGPIDLRYLVNLNIAQCVVPSFSFTCN